MSIADAIESSIFLRPLNYLRVRSEYARLYNWIYPTVITVVIYLICKLTPTPKGFDAFEEVFSQVSKILTILLPFYIASLAAVSTFTGAKFLDLPFASRIPLTLKIKLSESQWDTLILTPRNFLRLLFSYCTLSSLFLLVFLFARPIIIFSATNLPDSVAGTTVATIEIIALFFTSQLCLATIIGVYFLSDYLVRNDDN